MYRRKGLGSATPGASQAVANAAAQYGIDPALLAAVAKQESGLNQSAVSSAGAIGVMQLKPGTAASLGCDPNDMTSNIDCGAKYLSQLLAQFGGNEALALAAYNAGPGAVTKYGGVPPYAETQAYVSNILNSVGYGNAPVSIFGPTPDQLGTSTDTPSADASSVDLSSIDLSSMSPWTIAALAALGLGLVVWASS